MTIPQILADANNAALALTVEKNTTRDGSERNYATLSGNPAGLRTLARILTVMADALAEPEDDPMPWSVTLSPDDLDFLHTAGVAALTLRAEPPSS